jgi:hypothetical protein
MAKFNLYIQLHKNMEDKHMKCIKSNKTGNIIRVSNQQADQTVGREWKFVSKSEWKNKDKVEEPKISN